MNTAEYIVKRLEELGINDFFGLPGDYNFNILYAIENNRNTNWIGCINELNAGYAADGYARVRGYGAVVTTYGVGELSVINAIAGSTSENIPVVCIVGVPATKFIQEKTLLHHNLQEANYYAYMEAFKQVTSAVAYLTKDNAKSEIDRVLKVLTKEKKPVYIAIPDDIAQIEIPDSAPSLEWSSNKEALKKASEKIVQKINEARKPVIIGDVLVKRFDALIEYREFITNSGIPVSNFLMGTDLIDMEYEKYLGAYYSKFKNPIAQKYIEEADCLITVGAIYSDLNSYGMSLPHNINDSIAIYGTYTYIDGKRYDNLKMSELLEAVNKKLTPKDIEINKPNIGYRLINSGDEALTSGYIYQRFQEFFKPNDIIFAETGSVPYGISQIKYKDNTELELQTLWGSIGWATPAAMGAGIAKPQSRVILITGDGAHQLTAMEIGTMLRNGLKPVIIVISNSGYTIERLLSKNVGSKFNDIVQMNYAKFSRVFEGDVWATQVSTAEDFDKALKVTQIMNKMCYIEACIAQMDVPQLVRDIAQCMKDKSEQTDGEVINTERNIDTNNIISNVASSSFEYETIVHKAFITDNNQGGVL